MADINKRAPGCDDDCEGERGKRGKRGHRGHRGPNGGISVDPKTLSGDGSDENPLKVIGNPMWPPFPTIPPGEPITTTIYARVTGNDTTGDGTLTNPYLTFARAILAVPQVINPGYRFIVDITDIGVETLPQDWACPPIISNEELWVDPAPPAPYWLAATPLTIRATPKLALAPADSSISAADAAIVTTVGPGLSKVTIAVARPAWVPGSLKGLQVINPSQGASATCCIFDNTTTELFLCNNAASFNGGVGPLVLAPGATVDIVEPSATLQAPPAALVTKDPIEFSGLDAINFQGIKFTCTVPLAGNGSLGLISVAQPFFELCVIEEFGTAGSGAIQVGLFSTTVRGYVVAFNSSLTPRRSYWDAVGSTFAWSLGSGLHEFRQTVFDTCVTLGPAAGLVGAFPAAALNFLECWFKTSTGDALLMASPTRLEMYNCQIDGAMGNAISVNGPCKAVLTGVTGSANTGYGVITDDGAHVQVDAATTVGNADARAFTNGNNVPVAAWAGAAFNNADATTFSRVFEP